jgi:hypothetical protein
MASPGATPSSSNFNHLALAPPLLCPPAMDTIKYRRIEDGRRRLATPAALRAVYPQSWIDWRPILAKLKAKAAARTTPAR